jgi:hypothetical protein
LRDNDAKGAVRARAGFIGFIGWMRGGFIGAGNESDAVAQRPANV